MYLFVVFSLFVCLSVATLASTEVIEGFTTRYWDCCKASCAWSLKASVNHNVQVCAKDGVTALPAETTNICSGGGGAGHAYTCSNNQPWTINASLALGFTSARITGKAEVDWCCACYKITFTEGDVRGQVMIAQVTNTGGDLGKDNFDLQIPGGGVGQFNKGCHAQWGTNLDGWGARYGGLSSRDQCSQMPSHLQSGCHWRFDWFKNADNPAATFERVACPKSLIDKSKCKRSDESTVKNHHYISF